MTAAVLRADAGLEVAAESSSWWLPPLWCRAGEWVAVVPADETGGDDLAAAVARVLTTLVLPRRGSLELLGCDPARLSYSDLQGLRRRLGLVQGNGALLSNRTLGENIALPLAVRPGSAGIDTTGELAAMLAQLGLTGVAHLRPHQVDRATRFRARVARALIVKPEWVVVEGTGDWQPGGSAAWSLLMAAVAGGAAAAACLARPAPEFIAWLVEQGGRVVSCQRAGSSGVVGEEGER